MELAIAILAVLAPALAQLLPLLIDKYKSQQQQEAVNEAVDDVDTYINQIVAGDRSAYDRMAQRLERLVRDAHRKTGHP